MNELEQRWVHLSLTVDDEVLPHFCLLAGSGLRIRVRTGCSVRDLLCGQLGISPTYLEARIQTVFLDGSVVDDPQRATVAAGSTIALSAAMPGIAGAMLRRGSPYAPMRSQISHAGPAVAPAAARPDDVVIKLFNMLQGELGPALLARGVHSSGRALSDLFRGRSEVFRSGILVARIDGSAVDPRVPLEMDWAGQVVFLQVRSDSKVSS